MATPALVGTPSVYTASSSTVSRTVTVPSGVQNGDLIVVFASKSGSTNNVTISGLTLTTTQTDRTQSGQSATVGYKENASASDAGATITVTTPTAVRVSVIVAVFRGIPVASAIDLILTGQSASGTAPTAPAATSTAAGFRVDFIAGTANAAGITYTAAAGMTKAAEAVDAGTAGATFAALFTNLTPAAASTAWGANAYTGSASSITTSWTILIKQKIAADTVYPSVEISNPGGWTSFGSPSSNAAGLADALDTTGMSSPNNPIVTQTVEYKLDEISPTGDITIKTRADRGNATSGTQTIVLLQGSTTIVTWTDTLSASPANYTHITTSGQTATITDRNDLRVRYSQALS